MFSHQLDDVALKHAYQLGTLRPSRAADVQRHFAAVPLFADCSKRELRLVAKTAIIEPRAPGATLIAEGESGDDAYVILQGTCRVTRKGRKVAEVTEGGVVGELSMLNRAPRNATVIADTPLEVAILCRKDFIALLEASPSISLKLLTALAARVQELDARAPA
jgi:CRP/FNR family cyclic AMP-dependent transcriptional regulator